MNLREIIDAVLYDNDGRCLDEAEEREIVAKALDSALHKKIDKHICNSCGHLDEVHAFQGMGCHGGPETDCACKRFKR